MINDMHQRRRWDMNLLHAAARTSDSAVHASLPYVAFCTRSIRTWTEQCPCHRYAARPAV